MCKKDKCQNCGDCRTFKIGDKVKTEAGDIGIIGRYNDVDGLYIIEIDDKPNGIPSLRMVYSDEMEHYKE